MKKLYIIVLFFLGSLCQAAGVDKLQFVLFKQTKPYIYSVGYIGEGGKHRWYQLEWKEFKKGKAVVETCDVFYDAVSKNFYCTKNGSINIIPINQPYELFFEDKK